MLNVSEAIGEKQNSRKINFEEKYIKCKKNVCRDIKTFFSAL